MHKKKGRTKKEQKMMDDLFSQSFKKMKPKQQIDLIFEQKEVNQHVKKRKKQEAISKGVRKDLGRRLRRRLIKKNRKTTKSKGRSPRVSAKSGIKGFFRSGLYD